MKKNPLMWKYIWRRNGRGGSCWWWWAMAACPAGDFGRWRENHTRPSARPCYRTLLSMCTFIDICLLVKRKQKLSFLFYFYIYLTGNTAGCRIDRVHVIWWTASLGHAQPVYIYIIYMADCITCTCNQRVWSSPTLLVRLLGKGM